MSPFLFYSMTLREAKLAMKGHDNEARNNYYYNLYATTNAVGSCFGGKNFKPIDPFSSPKKANKKDAQYVRMLGAIGINARDVDEDWDESGYRELTTEEKRKLLFNK